MKLSAIKKNPQNPRLIKDYKFERLKQSIAEFPAMMSLRPIVIDESNTVLGGNMRLEAIKANGLKEIPDNWVKRAAELTDDEKARFVITDNSSFGEYDWDLIANEWTDYPLEDWGLDLPEFLDADTAPLEEDEAAVGEMIDKAAELNEKWKVKSGDLWQIGRHRLLCGDSTIAANVERLLNGESVACVSDPPYGIKVDTSWLSALHIKRGKPANKSDDKLQNDDGSLDLSICFSFKEWLLFGFPYLARDSNFTGLLVWDKRGDGGENGLGNPVEVAASNSFNGYRLSRHVWAGFVREAGEKREPHPTQKPIGIMADAIGLVKNKNIFDPFAGTASSIVAAEQLNRTCYAMELSPSYVAVCLERLTNLGLEAKLIK